jgi:cytochrome c-type biogenesis protein CcmH
VKSAQWSIGLLLIMFVAGATLGSAHAQGTPQMQSPTSQTTDSNSAHAGGTGTASPATPDESRAAVEDTAFDNKARMINMQLRCPVCQGSSIQESPSAEAIAMKAIVRERLAKGESEDQIKAYFVSRYGDWILLAPPATGMNLLVYVLPVVVLLSGGLFVFRKAKSWTQQA